MGVRRAVALIVLSVVLTGCSGGDDPAVTLPTLTSSASPAAATAGPTPSGINAATPQGAAAFTRHWYAEITRAWAARDPEIVRRLSAPGCVTCERYIRSITKARANGERIEGVIFNLRFVEAQGVTGPSVRVSVFYDGPQTRRYDKTGKLIHSEPAVTNFEEQITLIRQGGSWLVKEDAAV